jgi:hypothetical protein
MTTPFPLAARVIDVTAPPRIFRHSRRQQRQSRSPSWDEETNMRKIAATAFFAAILAGAVALAAGSPPVQIFHDIAVRPAHPGAPPDAIAEKFCRDNGFTEAGAHLFIGFIEYGSTLTAHFRQIACRTYELRRLDKPAEPSKDVTVGS